MTRRKTCVVCRERPAMPDDNWCWRCHDLILPDEIDALYRVASRTRMYERRRWVKAAMSEIRAWCGGNAPLEMAYRIIAAATKARKR
jgi:hypothetical protein